MKLLLKLAILTLLSHRAISSQIPKDPSDIGLDPKEIIENHGYTCETHYITTDDGYILAYHRIPHGINNTTSEKRPAVILMHGLTASSADFVSMGPGRSLAFILADLGYDVWIANARGNAFSRNHTSLDPVTDEEQFYNFSWHEIGFYDLPKAVDYILELNGDENLYYVGHSQGTTAFLVLVTTRPEYNAKIRIASLMAPAAILNHYPSNFIQSLCKYIDQVELILQKYKIYEIPYVKEIRESIVARCTDPNSDSLCDILYSLLLSGDGGQIEKEFLPVVSTNSPSNSGMKQYVHYGQQVKNGGFSQFDYGSEKNMEIYGTEAPPPYNFSKISVPIAFYYGNNDGIIAVEDVQTVISLVPNPVNDYLVPYELFRHVDFVFAKDIVKLVYNELISVMQKY